MLKFFLIILSAGVSIGMIYYDSITAGLIITLLLFTTYPKYRKINKKREEYSMLLEFRDLLFFISSSFYHGRSMKQALEEAENYYSENYDKNNIMLIELKTMKNEMNTSNLRDVDALKDFSRRNSLKDIVDFVNVYEYCIITGADISKVVERTASIIGDRITIQNELHSILSEKILEGRIILISAPIMIMLIRLMSPSYMSVMNNTTQGIILTTLSLALSAISLIIIDRLNGIEL